MLVVPSILSQECISGEASDTFYSVTGPSRSRSRSNVRVTVIEYPDYGPEQ